MASLSAAQRRPRLLVGIVLALVVGTVLVLRSTGDSTVLARFDTAPGLYAGDDVRVLGVKVGTVKSVKSRDGGVDVRFTLDGSEKVPASAHAAIVAPSLVSGRFVQLAPAWTGGPELGDGATIPADRTAVPISFDEVKKELTDLSTALGPQAGKRGSLNAAISTIEANLADGNSTQLRASVAALHDAAASLASGRSDLFATIHDLDVFTKNLAVHDAAVGGFTTELDHVSTVLSDNRTQVTGAVRDLRTALHASAGVLGSNQAELTRALRSTTTLTGTVASRADELAGVLHVAPHSLMGLYNIVDRQAITGRAVLANVDSVAALLCSAVLGAGGTAEACRTALLPLVNLLGLDRAGTAIPGGAGALTGGTSPVSPDTTKAVTGLLEQLGGGL
ncbi:MCE family protein [Nocardioides jejuensis]|uniref:MCE family protein n=1 Tax=Nocardioides jejuensis TaxID=2502782 RepID=A0A4R1CHW0_9ACTN|nr:MCE family protein [Nocardioides jejuensis]TCJ31024.1 MCE family protein [Nocardioides jejuensis]